MDTLKSFDSTLDSQSQHPQVSHLDEKSMKKIISFESIERFTECSFCLEQYKEPRILPCAHTYCTQCLRKMLNIRENLVTCAQCRMEHKLPSDNSVYIFPKNLALQQLIDIKPMELLSSNRCDECNSNYAFTNCLHCTKDVCLECKEKHLNEFKADLLDNLFKKLISRCNSLIEILKNDINKFLLDCNNVKLSINTTCNDFINEIKQKQDSMIDEVNNLVNNKMKIFHKFQESFMRKKEKIQHFLDKSTRSIHDNTISDDELIKLKKECELRVESLNELENIKYFNKKTYKIDFKVHDRLIEDLNLGTLTIEDTVQLNESISVDNSQRSSLSSISLLTSPNKTNLDLVKEQGIWRGGDSLEFWCPSGIAVDAKRDYLIISDSWNHRIQIINLLNLEHIRTIKSEENEFNSPRGVCIDALNRLIISDSGNNRIKMYDTNDFKFLSEFGKRGYEQGEFIQPIGVTVDDKNQIYVCDRGNCRIQVFDPKGVFMREWGSRGSAHGQFEYPEYLCISSQNHLLVTDTGNNRVQIFDLASFDVTSPAFSTFILSFGQHGSSPGCFRLPRGITTDSDGFIMISDYKNDRLQLFEPNGNFIKEINESCSEELNFPVYFDKPVAIATTPNGGLVVTEWGRSHKLQIF